MGIENFPRMRNLAFYDGYSPDYFYFNSLNTYQSKYDEYNTAAQKAAGDAEWGLSILPSFADSDETLAADKIDKIISFLETAIQYERANEIAFFNNKIAELKSAELEKIPEVAHLISMMNSDSFKYEEFIALVNVILQGVKNTKAIAEYEEKRLNELKSAMTNMQKASEKQLDGLWRSDKSAKIRANHKGDYTAFMRQAEARRQRRILITYAKNGRVLTGDTGSNKRGRLLGAKKYLSSITETADVKIAHWITNLVLSLLEEPSTKAEIAEAVQSRFKLEAPTQDDLEKKIKSIVITSATKFATEHISEILKDCYNDLSSSDLADLMQDSFTMAAELNIEGFYDNFGMFGNTLELFKDAATKEEAAENSAEALCDAYQKFRTEINKKKKSQLTKEQIITMKALKTGTVNDEYSEIYKLIRLLTTLKNQLAKSAKAADDWLEKNQNKFTFDDKNGGSSVTLKVQLTKDGQIDVQALNKGLRQTAMWQKLGGRGTRGKTIEGIISGIKDRTSRSIKEDLIEAIDPLTKIARKSGFGGETEVINAIKKSLGRIKISVGGPAFSEVKEGIQSALNNFNEYRFWTGKLNRKNDFITVSLNYDAPSFKKTLDRVASSQATDIVNAADERLQLIQKKYAEGLADYFYQELSKLQSESSDYNNYAKNAEIFFSYASKRQAAMQKAAELSTQVDSEWAIYQKEAEAAGVELEKINEQRQQVLTSLKDSFFQSSTMKTYNQYQNDIGFGGGSLGANLDAQLENLNTIFTAAGINLGTDLAWLRSAIINCSPFSVVGEKYKDIIEDYLGSLIAFALFDEGAAEATIIRGIQHKHTITSPKILHLYAVDSLYVPGSYVLQKVYDELIECRELAYKAYNVSRSGAGVAIINTMNEGMIPNRSVYIPGTHERISQASIESNLDTDPWGTVAGKAASHVSLKIFFLAGLIDIAHSINEKLGNIELPA